MVIGVKARDGIEYGFRFHCADYPHTAVTAQPWDIENDSRLPAEQWPTGQKRVSYAFNPGWHNGTCLYLPCDRQSIEGHENWRNEYPALLWDPKKGICKYLGNHPRAAELHRLRRAPWLVNRNSPYRP